MVLCHPAPDTNQAGASPDHRRLQAVCRNRMGGGDPDWLDVFEHLSAIYSTLFLDYTNVAPAATCATSRRGDRAGPRRNGLLPGPAERDPVRRPRRRGVLTWPPRRHQSPTGTAAIPCGGCGRTSGFACTRAGRCHTHGATRRRPYARRVLPRCRPGQRLPALHGPEPAQTTGDTTLTGQVRYDYMAHPREIPASYEVPIAQVRQAARAFWIAKSYRPDHSRLRVSGVLQVLTTVGVYPVIGVSGGSVSRFRLPASGH
ncbi:Imm1 family immunity protein [Amycolatopsis thermophila]|uniref:Uncharacterized protein n=1 Tax=Amycolatopsis thermophila TaxID=206084 RepID=A0ABU0F702_9PSEU|nr:hypothetical protein [Amycolatopsis thermophila]